MGQLVCVCSMGESQPVDKMIHASRVNGTVSQGFYSLLALIKSRYLFKKSQTVKASVLTFLGGTINLYK
jgi:hypothetical protein